MGVMIFCSISIILPHSTIMKAWKLWSLLFSIPNILTKVHSLTAAATTATAAMTTTAKATGRTTKVSMHWFRKGLRLTDNPALLAAIHNASRCYPVHVVDGDAYALRKCTVLRANFYIESLLDLDARLTTLGTKLYVCRGDPVKELPQLWKEWGITHLYYEEDETGEPYALERDAAIQKLAKETNICVETFCQETLHPIKSYIEKSGKKPPGTMGAFETLINTMPPIQPPKPAPKLGDFPKHQSHDSTTHCPPKSPLDLPWPRTTPRQHVTPLWGPTDCTHLTPLVHGGETLALRQLQRSILDRPAFTATFEKPKTSCTSPSPSTTALSPFLSMGCLSPRQVWFAIQEACDKTSVVPTKPPVSLHGQLLWRDFNHLMAHSANSNQPASWGRMEGNFYCRQVPWDANDEALTKWKTGQTGYPWIDACMMQLQKEGWIHHLGRHAVACFLTRGDLWQSWEAGAEHFESHLLDADYALNGFNWLWLSCSGFFYQYFRCYSPVAFQKKNDPSGAYIRKHLPVLARLPDKYIYEPWKAPLAIQQAAGVRIGVDYPKPMVDHAVASKENMAKMAKAYEVHNSGDGKTTKKGPSSDERNEPAKKKAKKQTQLKY
jgi:cryptochrome